MCRSPIEEVRTKYKPFPHGEEIDPWDWEISSPPSLADKFVLERCIILFYFLTIYNIFLIKENL